jgi:hypothetical protein
MAKSNSLLTVLSIAVFILTVSICLLYTEYQKERQISAINLEIAEMCDNNKQTYVYLGVLHAEHIAIETMRSNFKKHKDTAAYDIMYMAYRSKIDSISKKFKKDSIIIKIQ